MTLFDKFEPIAKVRRALAEQGIAPFGVVTERIISATEGIVNGRHAILAGTNNYLGLSFDPRCIQATVQAAQTQGTGTTGSRMANGTYSGHVALEQEIAEFYECPSAIVFSTGYLANLGMLSTVAGAGDVILLDADCHASIYDGCRMSDAEVIRFRHNDVADLEKRLRRLGPKASNTLILVEGIYSMLGDQAPLADIAAIKRQYGAYLVVDEAHSLGVLGKTGQGLVETSNTLADADFIIGTFSKSLAGIGGFCVSRLPELELIRFAIRPYVFTASPSPATIASTRVALQILRRGGDLRDRLWDNAHRLYAGLEALGFKLGPTPSPVIAAMMASQEQALLCWQRLLDQGVYVNLVLPPGAPNGASLLRCSVSAAHTPEQIERIIAAFASLGETIIGGQASTAQP
jgi:8-amino-7-oxononanoate synthase